MLSSFESLQEEKHAKQVHIQACTPTPPTAFCAPIPVALSLGLVLVVIYNFQTVTALKKVLQGYLHTLNISLHKHTDALRTFSILKGPSVD